MPPPPPPSQVGGMARPPRDYEPTPFVKPTIMPDDNSLPAGFGPSAGRGMWRSRARGQAVR